jgi:hypothetical protein
MVSVEPIDLACTDVFDLIDPVSVPVVTKVRRLNRDRDRIRPEDRNAETAFIADARV